MWESIKQNREYVFPLGYLFLIAAGLFFAFPIERVNMTSFYFLIIMTLPWSIVTLPVMFAIDEGVDNVSGLVAFSFTALLNAGLLFSMSRKPKDIR